MDTIVQPFLQYGVLGIMCAVLVLWIYTLDKQTRAERSAAAVQARADLEAAEERRSALQGELATEQRARVEDAQRFTGIALQLQGQAVEACSNLKRNTSEYKRLAELVEDMLKVMRDEDGRG